MALSNEIGCFSWFSLMTSDTDRASEFYTNLLGWTTEEYEVPGMDNTIVFKASGREFGNPVPLEQQGVPSHWISYIACRDVDESCKQAEKMGGTVSAQPFDMPTIGRIPMITDPSGATFHLYTPEDKDQEVKATGNEPGQICWLELMVDDPAPLIPFYRGLFGWKVSEPVDMGGGAYYSFEAADEMTGGFMKRPQNMPIMPPIWMPYFMVHKIDPVVIKSKELGGKVHIEKQDVPETGKFSLIEDPTGAMFYLFEFATGA